MSKKKGKEADQLEQGKEEVVNQITPTAENSKIEKKIYIGPHLVQLPKYTVIAEGLPKHIEAVIEKCPAIKKLLVPIKKLAEAEQKANQKGSLEYRNVQEVLSFLSQQRKGEK